MLKVKKKKSPGAGIETVNYMQSFKGKNNLAHCN